MLRYVLFWRKSWKGDGENSKGGEIRMKKFLSLVLALVMTMSLVTVSAGAKDFGDSADLSGEAYEEAVNVMSEMGIIDGYSDGDFRPQGTLTRQAAAKIIACMMLGKTTAESLGTQAAPFKDVPAGSSFAGYIAFCVERGLISGYADGTFRPTGTLTGFAFLKMLLGALGYDQSIEGYTGTNWTVNVAGRAYEIGLTDGNDNFVGSKACTREEAALYAVNTLQATLVEYENKGSSITINGIEVVQGASAPTYVTSSIYNQATSINDDKDNASGDYTVEFAERYQTDLRLDAETDAFERPARVWSWKGEEIGTYVDYSLMVAEYTTAVTGKEMYDVVGKTAFKDYDFSSFVDGEDDDFYKDISRNNDTDLDKTADGALTQVFVNSDDKEVIITVVNTYLAKATADYNDKKDTITLEVYGDTLSGSIKNQTLSGEDFAIADMEADDFVLVTYSDRDDEIQSIDDVEILSDVEISKFSTSGTKVTAVTVDGTKYNDSAKLDYDDAVLDDYTDSNLKDTTYNVYLDSYGYVIGVDIVDEVNKYVFITGIDPQDSNLTTKNFDANAIFLDGTSGVISVKNTDAVSNLDSPVVNKWFTYTVNSSDVYTLKEITYGNVGTNDVGQYHHNATRSGSDLTDNVIDHRHISLKGADNGAYSKVYGTDDTVYLLAELDKVHTNTQDYAVISDVDEVVTGIDNASFELYTITDARDEAKATNGTASANNTSSGAYPLYDDNGDIIAVVVVGESDSISENIAYLMTDGLEDESYDKSTEQWTWTRKAIINGEEVLLTEVGDDNESVLEDYDESTGRWVTVKYDANGNVKDLEKRDTIGSLNGAVTEIEKSDDTIVVAINDVTNDYTLKGKTLFDATTRKEGFRIDENVNIALSQIVKKNRTTEYYTGVTELKNILEELNGNKDGHLYDFNAVIEDGRAVAVVIYDHLGDGSDTTGPNGQPVKKGSLELTGVSYDTDGYKVDFKVTKEIKGADYYSVVITTESGAKVASVTKNFQNPGYTWTVGTTNSLKAESGEKAAEELKIVVNFYDDNDNVLATAEDFLVIETNP